MLRARETQMSFNFLFTVAVIFFIVESTIQPLENEIIHEGGNLNLSCNASGTPSPFVSWVWISTGQRFDGSVLELPNINRNQAGDYRCEAGNDCGNESKTAAVHVTCKFSLLFSCHSGLNWYK